MANNDQIDIMLDVCASETDKMSDWENSFIESVTNQFDHNGVLSEKQLTTLKIIYDKVV